MHHIREVKCHTRRPADLTVVRSPGHSRTFVATTHLQPNINIPFFYAKMPNNCSLLCKMRLDIIPYAMEEYEIYVLVQTLVVEKVFHVSSKFQITCK